MKRARESFEGEEVDGRQIYDSGGMREAKKPFLCPHDGCDKRYSKAAKLADHERTHTGERPFVCDTVGCAKAFFRKSHLQAHARSHLPREERPHECPVAGCGKRFSTNQHLRQHAELHSKPLSYVCEYCDKAFHKHNQLKRHIGEMHLKTKSWPCPVEGCNMSFHFESILQKHINRVHLSRKVYTCQTDDCCVVFNKWSLLQSHIKQAHKLACRYCKKQFTDRQAWQLHSETHELPLEERRRFPCTEPGCTKRFTKAHARSKHVAVAHHGRRDFVCDICQADFAHKKTLEAHISREHSGYTPAIQAKKQQSTQASIVDRLSGLHYETQRKLRCPHTSCRFRFLRNYDLERHLASYHSQSLAAQAADIAV